MYIVDVLLSKLIRFQLSAAYDVHSGMLDSYLKGNYFMILQSLGVMNENNFTFHIISIQLLHYYATINKGRDENNRK
jgi:hypothetical protein